MANLGAANDGSTGSLDPSEQFEMIASGQSFDKTPDTETAELEGDGEATPAPVTLDVEEKEGSNQGLITQALLVGDLESAVDLCIKDGMYPHALTLAAHAGPHLYDKTRDTVLKRVDGSLASLVGAVVRGDLTIITTTCKLSNWKEALVAILTYCSSEQFPRLAESLGERLESKGDPQALLSAMICYVCAGSLEKCVSCWIKTRPSANKPQDLQDLVEIIMGLQRSLSSAGHTVNLSEGNTVSSLLCQYASLLAAQGVLRTAVSYLNSATQGEMVALRDRLYRALGYPTASSMAAPATTHQDNLRRTSTPNIYGQPQPSQFTPSVQDQQRSMYGTPPSQPTSAPSTNPSFYNPMSPTPMVPQQITPMAPQYGAPPPISAAPPQGPPTGGLRRGRLGRYVPDASVTSPTSSSMHNPVQPSHYFTPTPGITPSSLKTPSAPPQFFSPTAPPTGGPIYTLGDPQQQPPVQPPPKTPAALDLSVPRGWNDPPPPSSSRKAKQQQQQQNEVAKPVEPIMCPVPGGGVPEPPQQFMGFQHPQFGTEALSSPAAGARPPVNDAAPAAAPEPAVKGPLPPEHQVIQDILNDIRNRCLLVVQNQQMKQRLEDIGTKMEVLYDKLRAGQLSPSSVSGVHKLIGHVQTGDYRSALTVHAETIANGSFSELSSFMPPLKLLLQYCMQLQVFLQ